MLVAPGVCLIASCISLLLDKFSIGRGINKVFDWIGKSTFEIFLVHMYWLSKVEHFAWAGERKKWILWFIEVAAICTVVVVIENLIKKLIKRFRR